MGRLIILRRIWSRILHMAVLFRAFPDGRGEELEVDVDS